MRPANASNLWDGAPLCRRSLLRGLAGGLLGELAGGLVGGMVGGLAGPAWAGAAQEYVLVIHPSAAVPSRKEVASLYLGLSRSMVALDLNLGPEQRREIYRALTGFELEQVQAQWAKLVFTGRGSPPRMMKGAQDLRRAVAADPRLIGYLPQSEVDESIKLAWVLG